MHRSMWIVLALAALGVAACSDYSVSMDNERGTDTGSNEAPDDGAYDTGNKSETENDFLALKPSETDIFIFIANPARDTVTRVNVFTLEVDTTEVGHDPRIVLTDPDYEFAAVFNRGDDSVTLLDAFSLDARTVGVRDNFNNMVMSPDGGWVALWHDVSAEEPDDPEPEGLQSFNEASFVNTDTGEHHAMAVGFNPRAIQFTADGTKALVVSDEYLAVVDLTADVLYPKLIQVAEDLLDPPVAEEVVITRSGRWAYVRQFGAEELVVVDLTDELVDRIPVGDNPTDLDLSPDGTHAVAVARGARQLWVFEAEQPFLAPEVLDLPGDEGLGSLLYDPTGHQAVIYTTASPTDRYATWDVLSGEITLRKLVKPVAGMAITPTGESMMAFHTLADAPGADPSSPFFGRWALSLINLDDFRTNPLLLPAEPIGYANSSSGDKGFFIMDSKPFLEVIDYRSLLYDEVRLRSNPVYVGVLPDLDPEDGDEPPAWASQEHDLGRITFYDPDDGSAETITGFELNSRIDE